MGRVGTEDTGVCTHTGMLSAEAKVLTEINTENQTTFRKLATVGFG